MPSKAIVQAVIVLRKDTRYKTWLQRIKAVNVAGVKSKNGKVYEFVAEYPEPVGQTAAEREYHVGSGWYMFCQPNAEANGRDIRRVVIDSTGSIREVSESELRSHFGLGPKTASKSAKVAYAISSNAVRFE